MYLFYSRVQITQSLETERKQYGAPNLKPPQRFLHKLYKMSPEKLQMQLNIFSEKKTPCIKLFCTGNLSDSSQWFTRSLEISKTGLCSSALSHYKDFP